MGTSLCEEARRAERVGLFGGSFDPVHAGHLHVARAARDAFGLEHVVFVPAARPPHKPGRVLAAARHRLAMLERALAGEEGFSVWDVELARGGPSYTIDTVNELLAARASREPPYLLLGSDNLRGLAGWREAGELLRRVRPIVVYRRGFDAAALDELAPRLDPGALERLRRGLLEVAPHPASATELRRALAAGERPGPDLLPPAVADYARSHGVYDREEA